jgi:hypothetical protein
MVSQHQGETKMTLPTNDGFAERELSWSELDAISGGRDYHPGGYRPPLSPYIPYAPVDGPHPGVPPLKLL